MTRQIVLRHQQSGSLRRQPLLSQGRPPPKISRVAEVAGGTAAECAAVCCCCPCGLVNLLVSAVVKLPAGLCRRAIKKSKHKRRAKKIGFVTQTQSGEVDRVQIQPLESVGPWAPEESPSAVITEMEAKMWAEFCSAGFWRSSSQREKTDDDHED